MTKVELCRVGDVPPGTMRKCEGVGPDPLLLVNDEGTFHLLEDDCTHAIASLSQGRLDGHFVFCPLHGGSFDIRTGRACSLPCKQSLRVFSVSVADGRIWWER